MKKITFLTVLFLAAILLPISGQYEIANYTDVNQVNSITEDGDYIWVCTSGGAFKRKKSDGSVVSVFNTQNSGIARNVVRCMHIDFYGNYWFGTYNGGISKFDGNEWTTIDRIGGSKIYDCKVITEDLDGNLWFGISQGKAIKYDGDTLELIDLQGQWYVGSILADDYGNIWFGVPGVNGGLWKRDQEGNIEVIHGPGNYFDSYGNGANDIIKDLEGNIWIACTDRVLKYNPYNDQWTDYQSSITQGNSISQDGQGNFWIGNSAGVYKYDGNTFTHIPSGETGDRVNLLLDVLCDAQDNVWLGSFKGLSKVNETEDGWTPRILVNAIQSNLVEDIAFLSDGSARLYGQYGYGIKYDGSYFTDFSGNDGCNYSWIKNLDIDENDNTWMSFLSYADDKLKVIKTDIDGNATCYSFNNIVDVNYNDTYVNDIAYDEFNQAIWVATDSNLYFKSTEGSIKFAYNKVNNGFLSDAISGVDAKNGEVWFSTADQGIGYMIEDEIGFLTSDDGLPSNNTQDILIDEDNGIWIISGLNLSHYQEGTFTNYPLPFYSTNLSKDNHGNIWMGGSNGAIKFNGETMRTFTIDDGLIENYVNNIRVDREDNIWFASGYFGVSKLTPVAPVADFETMVTCLPGATTLVNTTSNADELTRYEWDIDNDGTVDYTTKDLNHQFEKKGKYTVKLTAYNDNLSSEVIKSIIVVESPELDMTPSGEFNICSGEEIQLFVNILNYNSDLNYTFDWNTGDKHVRIITDSSGIYYTNVSNGICTSSSDTVTITTVEPNNEVEICMVTVDSVLQKNMIIWERPLDNSIVSYNVYKLYGNNYVPIGNVGQNDRLSLYVDYQSTPDALAARYAVSVIDTCGNESEISPYHQTIHLGASEGSVPNTIVLDWTPYIDESGSLDPEWYYIYGGSSQDNMSLITQVSGSFTEYNDNSPGDKKYYQIEVRKSNPCFADFRNSKKVTAGPFVHSLSNLEDNRLKASIEESLIEGKLAIYPNPFDIETKIIWKNESGNPCSLYLMDMKGSVIREVHNLYETEYTLKREELSKGMYFIKIVGDKTMQDKIIVK